MSSMENFPGNQKNVLGDNKKAPEKNIEKVVTGEVVTRKKPLGRKFKEVFFGGDFKTAFRHIGAEVLLPAFRNLIYDTITEGGKRIIYGESARGARRYPDPRPRVTYNQPVFRGPRDLRDPRESRVYLPDQPPHVVRTNRHEVNELILSSREEAEKVLEMLDEIIATYQVASVGDLYDLVGFPTNYVDQKWGWSYLNNVEIRQIREGFLLDLPPVEAIQ